MTDTEPIGQRCTSNKLNVLSPLFAPFNNFCKEASSLYPLAENQLRLSGSISQPSACIQVSALNIFQRSYFESW